MPAVAVPSPDAVVQRLQLELADLGRAFPGATLTREGVLNAPCPTSPLHRMLIRLDDRGSFVFVCPRCARSAASRERFTAALNARLPWQTESVPQPRPVPVTPWVRQPHDAPALALRRLCDGRIEYLAEAERADEARRWIEAEQERSA